MKSLMKYILLFCFSGYVYVCLPFSLVWGAISAVTIPFMDYIDYEVFNYMPNTTPYYKIFGKTFHMKGGW